MNPFARFLSPYKPVYLCIGANPPPLGDTNLYTPDFDALKPLLEQVGARYDLISMDAGTGMDVKELMSEHCTLVLLSRELFTSPIQMNKCWLHVRRDGWHAYYFSHEHAGGPCPTEDPQAWLTHRKGTLVDRTNACPDTAERHAAAAQELEARNEWGSEIGMFDLSIKDLGTKLQFTPRAFPLLSRSVPLLQKHWIKLFDERLLWQVMRNPSDRAMLRSIVTSNHWRIQPNALEYIQEAFGLHNNRHAPFTEQTEPQRLAWLDEVSTVERRVLTTSPLFSAFPDAKPYPVRVAYCDTEGDTQRPASDGTAEDVTIHGRTMIAIVIGEQGREHRFGYQCEHTWADFLALFHPPKVDDIAALNPEKYQAARHWLIQFAHKLTITCDLTAKNEPAPAA